MRLRGGVLVMLVTWLTVVLVGATAVWAVISRAGEDLVTGASQPLLSPAATSASPPTTIAPSGPLEHRPKQPTSPRQTPEADPSESGTPTSAPGPSTPPSPTPSAGSSGSQPPKQPAVPSGKTGTWSGKPGSVTMTCKADGTRGNYSVYARGGWVAETEQEHGGLEVHFHRTSGDGEVELKAYCSGGTPRFEAHEDDD